MYIDEKIFKCEFDIKYIFKKCSNSEKLIIIFSAYDKIAKYNYLKVLDGIEYNRLYILDNYGYEGRGCWYLGENLSFNVEESVYKLIEYIKLKYNIKNENIISMGSSKGGFASLYYGIKYKFKHIIACAPQVVLYDYLMNPFYKETLISMKSKSDDKTKEVLNNIILDLDIDESSKFYLFCGYKDPHFKYHLIPFLKNIDLSRNNVYIELFDCDHKEIGGFFSERLQNLIECINNDSVHFSNNKYIEEIIKNNNL